MRTVTRVLIILSCVAGVLGGLLFEHHAKVGAVLIIGGLVGTIYAFLDSDEKQKRADEFAETTALLLVGAGFENPYTKIIQNELQKGEPIRGFWQSWRRYFPLRPMMSTRSISSLSFRR